MDITQYKTIIFDSHGVVLDSNITKIDSYFRTAKKLGGTDEQAQALVDYHVQYGGIGSYPKFKWYIEAVLKEPVVTQKIQDYMEAFSLAVTKGLLTCRIAAGLEQLREKTAHAKWFLVTEGDQAETQTLFEKRNLARFFDGGIWGSPKDKKAILTKLTENQSITMPALFIGDAKNDFEIAMQTHLDFVFLSNWTDASDWESFCKNKSIQVFKDIQSL